MTERALNIQTWLAALDIFFAFLIIKEGTPSRAAQAKMRGQFLP
jgi:hypothetical protein